MHTVLQRVQSSAEPVPRRRKRSNVECYYLSNREARAQRHTNEREDGESYRRDRDAARQRRHGVSESALPLHTDDEKSTSKRV
ncbi:unnamed protein product [Leptosia nina]|uniref:Uncharacterized protein n=1 Tax=Leptosia nina TaxID=320188 RepID=A0AAV1JX74_9NEOP